MQKTMEKTQLQFAQESSLPKIPPLTDADIIAYLRRNYKMGEIATNAERDALILAICDRRGITVSEEELQAAGDSFRLEHKLLSSSQTLSWLQEQRITVEDWSSGIRVALLTKKLKEELFGASVDSYYINNRKNYKRIAFSQILVSEETDALKIAAAIQQDKAAFCALALEYSKDRQSKQNGGFVGIHFLSRLMPEVAEAVSEAKEGEVVGPIQTKFGYHIIKIEKMFPPQLSESVRDEILESLFKNWLKD